MTGSSRAVRAGATALFLAIAFVALFASRAEAVGAEGEGWPAFGESDGCGSPWMRGPKVQASGWLSGSAILRGPHADYFGRTIQQVWDSLRWWDVPMSNGESLRLHQRMFPALQQVEANLAEAASNGNFYSIQSRYTFGYAARTVGGSYRVSQHGLGNALDINSNTNPYTSGKLKTNMPSWFVSAFSDAGYCWGGNWQSVKDAMHYNWKGPIFTPGMTTLPASYAPLTSPENYSRSMYAATVPGAIDGTRFRLLMDGDADGAIDVVNVSDTASGGVIDVLRASSGFEGCVVSRYPTSRIPSGSVAINGDWDRDGAPDLWVIDDRDGIEVTAFLRFGDFSESDSATVAAPPGDAYLAADHNVDGWTDLYILRYDGGTWTVEVKDGKTKFASTLASGSFAGDATRVFSALDRNRDQVPDLIGVGSGTSIIVDGASGFTNVDVVTGFSGTFDDVAGSDFDGDGRHDVVLLEGSNLKVYAGNTRLPGLLVTSWFEYPDYSCSGGALAYPYEGPFRDDENSVHRYDIEAIAEIGVTKGCNPPLNDRFCPERTITRGELAAFLRRALALPSSSANTFTDDDQSEFEGDIEALVAAGITSGCSPDGTRFCPDRLLTRAEMAVFVARAFDLAPSTDDRFSDDDGHWAEASINALATVGVTKGCNPPKNDQFCPGRILSRQEMASFMVRALALVSA